jgi:hypothetical protein
MSEYDRNTRTNSNCRTGGRPKPIQVTGWVWRYYDDRGFGFAESADVMVDHPGTGHPTRASIYFNKKQCREVEGTYLEPVLTRRPTETFVGGGRNHDEVIMLVVPNDRPDKFGVPTYRAIAWGKLPKKPWSVNYLEGHGLQPYVGREVSLLRDRDINRGRRGTELWRGTVEHLVLTLDTLTLKVRCPGETTEIVVSVAESWQGYTKHGNRLIIKIRGEYPEDDRWLLFDS